METRRGHIKVDESTRGTGKRVSTTVETLIPTGSGYPPHEDERQNKIPSEEIRDLKEKG